MYNRTNRSIISLGSEGLTMYLGAHAQTGSIGVSLMEAIKYTETIGGNLLQVFITNPQTGKGLRVKTNKELKSIKDYINKKNIKLVIHSPYVINLARPFDKNSWWIKSYIKELKHISKFGPNCLGSVIHLGKTNYTIKGEKNSILQEEGYSNMVKSFKYIIDNIPKTINPIIETSSGQGSELGYKIEDFAKFYNMFPEKYKKRINVCVDTCHIFAGGHDIRNKKTVLKYFEKFNKLIGLENLTLIHLNDSDRALGSKKDRHENLGNGKIGLNGLKEIILFAKKYYIPLLLETPNRMEDTKTMHEKEISYIKSL